MHHHLREHGGVRLCQPWKRRFVTLSESALEYYRELEPETIGGRATPHGPYRRFPAA
jgi:hypothetical protein